MGLLTGWLGLDTAFRCAAALFAVAALVLIVFARRLFAAPVERRAVTPATRRAGTR
jgi:membrane protein implicated in regulation of membrane protease activity